MKEYENVKEKLEKNGDEIDLTIGIGHHPLSWLNPQEEYYQPRLRNVLYSCL